MDSENNIIKKIQERISQANATLPANDYPFPLYVIVEPTNICNLSCVMCPSSAQTRTRGYMSMNLWNKIVDEITEKSPETVIWPAIMGESLVAGDLFIEMLEYACTRKAKIVWNTNAVLLNDRWLQRILALELKEIIIGIDAINEITYNNIRCGGNFRKMMDNVIKLLKNNNGRTKITVQFIEQEMNSGEKELFKEFWLSKGAVVKIRPKLGWGNAVQTPTLILGQEERKGPCPWLIRTVSIHYNGTVVQCDADWDQKYAVGNIAKNTLEEIWLGELAERRIKHRKMDFDFEPCKHCSDWQAGLSEFFYPTNWNKS
ncbi:MAG: radical SAM protein [Negativicutes bacterium]|nr:radical SAM protein [Negativicutes bacterium]